MLGAIREKYSNIPIPGAEISLDGAALRSEAQTEKDNLMTQLRETLEELSRKVQFENRANEAKQQQEMLQKVPLAIYIG
jgi:aspartate/tyrosine/aromatic aminotransferase